MKIEKLPSGSYRMRKMYQGRTYTIITCYKPTQKEALQLMAAELNKEQDSCRGMTFQGAAESYINMKRNVLSPKTIKEYVGMEKRLPEWFRGLPISDITQVEVTQLVNELCRNKSPKTVRNNYSFLTAVLGTFRPNLKISTTLPQKVKKESYTPSREDVKKILSAAEGSTYEIPITLACYGMRRSEICALEASDVEEDVVHINKALVQDEKGEWVIKGTKTTESTRDIIIPTELAEKIKKQGYVYKGNPAGIAKYLGRIEKKLGIPHFSLHKLRHYFASEMSALGIPEADILRLGGWETDYVMKSVYRHSMMEKQEKAKREAAGKFQNVLFAKNQEAL